jgi:hypothetical protein
MQAHLLKATLAKALDVAETFAGDVEFYRLTRIFPAGRQCASSEIARGS